MATIAIAADTHRRTPPDRRGGERGRRHGRVVRGHDVPRLQKLLEGKDPRDATFVTSRFCGVCFSVHTMASSLASTTPSAVVPEGGRLMN